MPESPTVSVVLLSYNQAEYLAQSVESVRAQTYADWELLVVDNGSTDGSRQLLEALPPDPRVRLVLHDENQPPTVRLNAAIRQTRGRYVSLLYSDDFYLPEKLERQVAAFAGADPLVGVVTGPGYRLNVTTGQRWIDPAFAGEGDVLLTLLEQLGRGPFMNPIAPLMKRSCFERHPFNEALFVEGESIFLRFAIDHGFRHLPEPLVVMRDHPHNMGRSVRRNYGWLLSSLEGMARDPSFPARARPALKALTARTMRVAGWEGVRAVNDPTWARQMFLGAARVDPRQLAHPKLLLGMGLSLLPERARTAVHALLLRLRPQAGHSNFVTEEEARTRP